MNIIQVYKQFPTHEDCLTHLEKVRWAGTPACPYCGSINSTPLKKEHRHHCNDCNTSYSVTVGTIFHRTHLDLQKWFLALTLILNAKKGLSARQLGRDIEVHRNTAWRISMQFRKAMAEGAQRELLQGIVEMDETYIGGKPRKGKKDKDDPPKRGRGTKKTPVVGMIERGGKVKAQSMANKPLNAKNLSALVRRNVDIKRATLYTDEYKGYLGIKKFMPHKTVNHTIWYVAGDVSTNSIESFWALLKRGLVGQYHKVSLRWLPAYLNEFAYRHNHRKHDDLFGLTIRRAVGVLHQ